MSIIHIDEISQQSSLIKATLASEWLRGLIESCALKTCPDLCTRMGAGWALFACLTLFTCYATFHFFTGWPFTYYLHGLEFELVKPEYAIL